MKSSEMEPKLRILRQYLPVLHLQKLHAQQYVRIRNNLCPEARRRSTCEEIKHGCNSDGRRTTHETTRIGSCVQLRRVLGNDRLEISATILLISWYFFCCLVWRYPIVQLQPFKRRIRKQRWLKQWERNRATLHQQLSTKFHRNNFLEKMDHIMLDNGETTLEVESWNIRFFFAVGTIGESKGVQQGDAHFVGLRRLPSIKENRKKVGKEGKQVE